MADQIVRLEEVSKRVRKHPVTIWRAVRKGTFPAPLQLSENSIGWLEAEIDAWIASRPRVSWAPKPEAASTEADANAEAA